jgi:putative tryptophan/tyrosine transport system substrate-binding protein
VNRRAFLGGAVSVALARPLVAAAQPAAGKVYRIGFLGGGSPSGYAPHVAALRVGLQDHGYVEGQNIMLDFQWAEGQPPLPASPTSQTPPHTGTPP